MAGAGFGRGMALIAVGKGDTAISQPLEAAGKILARYSLNRSVENWSTEMATISLGSGAVSVAVRPRPEGRSGADHGASGHQNSGKFHGNNRYPFLVSGAHFSP